MSDTLALDLVRALAVPDSPLGPVRIERKADYRVWSSNGIWIDRHTRREEDDTIALTFEHPWTRETATLHFRRDVVPGEWYCPEANAAVTDEVMERALDAGRARR